MEPPENSSRRTFSESVRRISVSKTPDTFLHAVFWWVLHPSSAPTAEPACTLTSAFLSFLSGRTINRFITSLRSWLITTAVSFYCAPASRVTNKHSKAPKRPRETDAKWRMGMCYEQTNHKQAGGQNKKPDLCRGVEVVFYLPAFSYSQLWISRSTESCSSVELFNHTTAVWVCVSRWGKGNAFKTLQVFPEYFIDVCFSISSSQSVRLLGNQYW